MKNINIIGAGLVGSLLSVMLAKKGYKVSVSERRPDLRKANISAGRSINLALSHRGWKALETIGISDEIKKIAVPMYGRTIHLATGEMHYQPYGKENEAIYSVSRGGLNCLLMDIAEKYGVDLAFEQRCTGIDFKNSEIQFESIDGKANKQKFDHTFSADGAFSAARHQMETIDRYNYSQQYLEHGYKELTIPALANNEWALEKNTLHIWPRHRYMLIALPNMDGSFTCTLFFPFEGENSFASIQNEDELNKFFEEVFPDIMGLMPTLQKDFFDNPTSSLVTVKCFPWSYEDKLLLIGDAAHAIVPFFGQGMNCGFEDCTVLDELLATYKGDFKTVFKVFEKERKPNTDAIAELAVENFIEMRDKVADPKFLLRKKIEAKINQRFPEKWIPLYSMVTFTHIPYSKALEEGEKQKTIMDKVMAIKDIEQKWDNEEVMNMINELITEGALA